MYRPKLLTFIIMILMLNSNPTLAADEFNLHYSADLRTTQVFEWRIDNVNFNYLIDSENFDPTNIVYSEEIYQSGIAYFPTTEGIPAETNGSIYKLTVNEDIDLVSSFDQLIFSFDYSVTLDDVTMPKEVDGLDVSKPLFNFFMQPSDVVFENETRMDYFEFIGSGSISYEESLISNYNRVGFYPSRISDLSSFATDTQFFEIEKTADCIAADPQQQTCNSIDSFVEYQTITRVYDRTSGKLIKYDYTENRQFDSNDRLYPSNVVFNLTNIDTTSGSGPEIPVITDDGSDLEIPESALYISILIVGAFIAVLAFRRIRS